MMLLSPNWLCAQALQDRLPSAHRLSYPLARQPGHELREVPQLALGICGCQMRWLRAGWHMVLHTCSSQELEDRARHPLSRSVPSSLCFLLLWHQHVPRCLGVSGQPLCFLDPRSVLSSAPGGQSWTKESSWVLRSSEFGQWHLVFSACKGYMSSLTETFLYCAKGYQAAQDN